MKKKATFIIPAYIKNEQYLGFLEQAIQGIMKQSDSDWNAIIIEDCSPYKRTRQIIEKYKMMDKRIDVIYLNERKTTGECRNLGIEWADKVGASYILFNDADDISNSNRVRWVKETFDRYENIDMIYSSPEIIDEFSKKKSYSQIPIPIQEIIDQLNSNPLFGKECWYEMGVRTGYINVTSTTSVRIELAKQCPFPKEVISEDMHTWYRYSAIGELFFDNRWHCMYRIPSFAKRQSSASYVEDFAREKVRVDIQGFNQALDIVEESEKISKKQRTIIEVQFLLRLMESMEKDNRFDLVSSLIEICKQKALNIIL